MGKGYLLDTNAVIYYLGGVLTKKTEIQFDEIINHGVRISVISKIKLMACSRPSASEQSQINNFLRESVNINLTEEVVEKTIFIRRAYKKVKMPDAIIAGTCLADQLTLIPRNIKDFTVIDGLDIYNPFDIE